MRRLWCAPGLTLVLAACSGSSGGITPSVIAPGSQVLTHNALVSEQTDKPITLSGYPQWVFRLGYVSNPLGYSRPTPDGSCSSPQLSLPNWTSSFKDGGSTYCYQMIGARPNRTSAGTTLTTQIYAYKLTFSNGDVFDPTAINASCDSVSPYTRFTASPLYNEVPMVNGKVELGTIQYLDAQSLGEWYKFVKTDKRYFLNLKDTGRPKVISVTVPANEGSTRTISGFCNGVIGLVNVDWLASQISTVKWNVKQISIVLLWDVFQTSSNFFYGGYHTYYQNRRGENGVASVITMSNKGATSSKGIQDVSIAAHELGETINDPFAYNIVPQWGHIGQQTSCQNNLEVGDPLTGTDYNGSRGIQLKGFRYHPQELAYFNWFTQQTKYADYGADDVYSMSGTFTSPAAYCSY